MIECELKDVDVLEIDEDEEDALLEVIFRTTEVYVIHIIHPMHTHTHTHTHTTHMPS